MDGKKALYYGAIAVAILVGVSVLVSVVSAVLSLAWAVISGIVSLAVLAGVVYVAYKLGSRVLGGSGASADASSIGESWSTGSTAADREPESRRDRLRRQYVEGQIGEDEFERRIASELETEGLDEIDRELERER
ncbi:MAG: hypothetical protein ACOC06_08360 [Halorubrum sp.]